MEIKLNPPADKNPVMVIYDPNHGWRTNREVAANAKSNVELKALGFRPRMINGYWFALTTDPVIALKAVDYLTSEAEEAARESIAKGGAARVPGRPAQAAPAAPTIDYVPQRKVWLSTPRDWNWAKKLEGYGFRFEKDQQGQWRSVTADPKVALRVKELLTPGALQAAEEAGRPHLEMTWSTAHGAFVLWGLETISDEDAAEIRKRDGWYTQSVEVSSGNWQRPLATRLVTAAAAFENYAGPEVKERIARLFENLRASDPHRGSCEGLPVPEGRSFRPSQCEGIRFMLRNKRTLLADDMGVGKCLGPESLVLLNGSYVSAEDAWNRYAVNVREEDGGEWASTSEPLLAQSIDASGKMVASRVSRLYRERISGPVRRVTMEDGSRVTTTLAHKFLKVDGWDRRLEVGDSVCCPRFVRQAGLGGVTDASLGELWGWQIGDGNEGASFAKVTQKDVSVLARLKVIASAVGKANRLKMGTMPISMQSDKRASYLLVSSADYRDFCVPMDFPWGELSGKRRVPKSIMTATDDVAAAFLRAYFDADGTVAKTGAVQTCSASRRLLVDVACLLRRWGIWMRLSRTEKCATNGTRIKREYWVGNIGGTSARLYARHVGFGVSEKAELLGKFIAKPANNNVDVVSARGILSDAADVTGLSLRQLGVRPQYASGGSNPGSDVAREILAVWDKILDGTARQEYEALPNSKWTSTVLGAYRSMDLDAFRACRDRLHVAIEREVFYNKVESVDILYHDGYVYDFEVPEHHNYVAENVLVHNTAQVCGLVNSDASIRNVLVLCPATLKNVWRREADKWLTRSFGVYVVPDVSEPVPEDADFVVANYDRLVRENAVTKTLETRKWDLLVCDESQKLKNYKAKRTISIFGGMVDGRWREGYSARAGRLVCASGTPIANKPADLFTTLRALDALPKELRSFRTFAMRYSGAYEDEVYVKGGGGQKQTVLVVRNVATNAEELSTMLRSTVMIRRLKKDVLSELPPKERQLIPLSLRDIKDSGLRRRLGSGASTEELQAIVDEVKREVEAALKRGENIDMEAVLKKIKRGSKVAFENIADVRKELALEKVPHAIQYVEVLLDSVQKVVVMAHHREVEGALYEAFDGLFKERYEASEEDEKSEKVRERVVMIRGGVSMKERDQIIQDFQNDPAVRVFIGGITATESGVTLTAAQNMVFVEVAWEPVTLQQAEDRIHRIGSSLTQPAQYGYLIVEGTLDEYMLSMTIAKINDGIAPIMDVMPEVPPEGAPSEHFILPSLPEPPVAILATPAEVKAVPKEERGDFVATAPTVTLDEQGKPASVDVPLLPEREAQDRTERWAQSVLEELASGAKVPRRSWDGIAEITGSRGKPTVERVVRQLQRTKGKLTEGDWKLAKALAYSANGGKPEDLAPSEGQARGPKGAVDLWAQQAILTLAAGDPDKAFEINGVGFSKAHSLRGHSLSVLIELELMTDRDWEEAIEIARYHHRQVGEMPKDDGGDDGDDGGGKPTKKTRKPRKKASAEATAGEVAEATEMPSTDETGRAVLTEPPLPPQPEPPLPPLEYAIDAVLLGRVGANLFPAISPEEQATDYEVDLDTLMEDAKAFRCLTWWKKRPEGKLTGFGPYTGAKFEIRQDKRMLRSVLLADENSTAMKFWGESGAEWATRVLVRQAAELEYEKIAADPQLVGEAQLWSELWGRVWSTNLGEIESEDPTWAESGGVREEPIIDAVTWLSEGNNEVLRVLAPRFRERWFKFPQ